MTPITTPVHVRIAAELAVHRGDLTGARLHIEQALLSAPPEHRPDLEEARDWLDELLPRRDSWVGEA